MKLPRISFKGHQWHRYGLLNVLLGLGTLVSLILGSGADTVWK